MINIAISVRGGCAEPEYVPAGVRVCITDYDVDGVPDDELFTDGDTGEEYILTVWVN